MTSPAPSNQYLSPSPSPSHPTTSHATPTSGSSAPPPLHFPIPLFPTATSTASISQELSLLKPDKAMFPANFLNKFDPSKISFNSTLASLQPEPPRLGSTPGAVNSDSEDEDTANIRSSSPIIPNFGIRAPENQSENSPPSSS